MAKNTGTPRPAPYGKKYYVIVDFEATCKETGLISPQEIIEFPAVIVQASTNKVVAEFRRFVRPERVPLLTAFCTKLTGITQEQVDGGAPFKAVVRDFNAWLAKNGLYGDNFIFVTCGDWDFRTAYPAQCKLSGVGVDGHCRRWLNLKAAFKVFYRQVDGRPQKKSGMLDMLERLGLEHRGRLHSGIDDCRNLARIWIMMADNGLLIMDEIGALFL